MSLNINLVAEAQVPANDPSFLQKVFALVSKGNKKQQANQKDPLVSAIIEEYNGISWRADTVRIQDSSSIRNVLRAREIAKHLIDDEGRLALPKLDLAIAALEHYVYPLGPARTFDAERQEWMLTALRRLKESTELQRLIKNIHAPHANVIAGEMIRASLELPDSHGVNNADARRAALAAWLTYLRQSVGSCFATAPTIIIHQEQSEQFFRDIADLLSIGQLKRTFGGKEYSAPLSPSWGAGDLKKPFALGGEEGATEFWLSPGLLAALEKLEIIDPSKPLKMRIARAKKMVLKMVEGKAPIMTSPEEVMKHIILDHLSLNEQDILDAEKRSTSIPSNFLHGSQIAASGAKSASVKKYYQMRQVAESAFKAIADCALLKGWEFTVASFAETKPTFTRWNLYAALGFNTGEEGGIADTVYAIAQKNLDRQNNEVQEYQIQYDSMYPIIRGLETRLRTASTEKEIEWLRSDYQNKVYEFRRIEQLRDEAQQKARWWANVGNMLISYYDMLFPQYFQEVYDADMVDIGSNPYDDSPAGFRLLYKWGRTNTSQWTRIHSADEFIEALANFFMITERELGNYAEFAGRERELSELISDIIRQIRSREFLETAFNRMADAHRVPRTEDPLNNLDKISKKPWVYTSGGSMNSLIGCYWKRESQLTEVEKWVESPTELFIFILDTLKEVPNNILDLYEQTRTKSMLIHSPTHAFLLKPGAPTVQKGWMNKDFTYTWVRDATILPKDHFLNQIKLDQSQMEFLIELIAEAIPQAYRHFFRRTCSTMWGTATPQQFREEIVKKVQGENGLYYYGQPVVSEELVDSILYTHLPLTSIESVEKKIEAIVSPLPGMEKISKNVLNHVTDQIRKNLIGFRWVSAKQLHNICCAVVLICLNETAFKHDYHKLIVESARKEGAMLPEPVVFADTNWVKDKFSFVVNPGTSKLELWRTDRLGAIGFPMADWVEWLDGSRKDRKWGIYSRPHEYVSSDTIRFMR